MTEQLEEAIHEAALLPPQEQDALAALLREEMRSESQWEALFRQSPDALARMAADALAEHRTGRTETLDPDRL